MSGFLPRRSTISGELLKDQSFCCCEASVSYLIFVDLNSCLTTHSRSRKNLCCVSIHGFQLFDNVLTVRLRSKVIDRLLVELGEDGTTNRLAYFYCNRAEENRRNPESILNALVQQLARTRLGIVKSVVDLYNERKEKGQRTSPLTLRETQNLFITLTDIYPQTTICLDALDEVDREIRIKLLKSLKSVIDNSKSVVKIFATSRNDPDILRQFKTFPRIEVQPDDSCEDIRKFISTRMETVIADESLLFGDVGDELKSQIHDSLSTRSRGM